jgi:hypothetical protein
LERQSGKKVQAARLGKAAENLVSVFLKAYCRQNGTEIRVADTAQHKQNQKQSRELHQHWQMQHIYTKVESSNSLCM